MSRIIFFIFICMLFLTTSCKKKEYSDISPAATSVFYCKGIVNGTPMDLQAGVNDYYMYSSYIQGANNVYNFTGDLKQTTCASCNNRIQFQINDFQMSATNASAVINTSLVPAYYSLQVPGGAPTKFPVIFISLPSKNDIAQTYLWNFGDGTTSADVNPIHPFLHPGYYTVCLTITYASSCTSTICTQITVGVPDTVCSAAILSPDTGNIISFSAAAKGTAPFTYSWDFGNGNTSTLQNAANNYLSPGIYKVHLHVKDASNYVADAYKNVSTPGFSGCFTNFKFYRDTISAVANPYAFSNVTIRYTDNAGITYTSNDTLQTKDSYFRIISVEDYLNNNNNQLTKKLHVNFKCKVFNGSNYLQIDNGDAVIAVAYK